MPLLFFREVSMDVILAGAKFRPAEAKEVIRGLAPNDKLTLEREPDNEYDEFAVRILKDGVFIGYVPKEVSEEVSTRLDNGEEPEVTADGFAGDLRPYVHIQWADGDSAE